MGLFDGLRNLASGALGDALGGLVDGASGVQGENLDLGSIAERMGLPTDVIGQISGLLGR